MRKRQKGLGRGAQNASWTQRPVPPLYTSLPLLTLHQSTHWTPYSKFPIMWTPQHFISINRPLSPPEYFWENWRKLPYYNFLLFISWITTEQTIIIKTMKSIIQKWVNGSLAGLNTFPNSQSKILPYFKGINTVCFGCKREGFRYKKKIIIVIA